MRPLDFIRTKTGEVGLITEVNVSGANVEFFKIYGDNLKVAWYEEDEIEIIDNLADLLSRELAHPFGNNSYQPYKK